MRRNSRKSRKPFKNTAKYSTTDFLKILSVIIDDPSNRSFQWGDGGSVVVNGELYEEELSRCIELSTLTELKDVTGLHTSMLAHGFKKMARMSRGNVHVFQHPNFSIKSAHLKKAVKRKSEGTGSSRSRPQRRKPLRKTSDQRLMDRQHSPSSSHLFPPAKRRKARSLYQYINHEFTLTDSHHSSISHLEQQPIDLHTAAHLEQQPIDLNTAAHLEQQPIDLHTAAHLEQQPIDLHTAAHLEQQPIDLHTAAHLEQQPIDLHTAAHLEQQPIDLHTAAHLEQQPIDLHTATHLEQQPIDLHTATHLEQQPIDLHTAAHLEQQPIDLHTATHMILS